MSAAQHIITWAAHSGCTWAAVTSLAVIAALARSAYRDITACERAKRQAGQMPLAVVMKEPDE